MSFPTQNVARGSKNKTAAPSRKPPSWTAARRREDRSQVLDEPPEEPLDELPDEPLDELPADPLDELPDEPPESPPELEPPPFEDE